MRRTRVRDALLLIAVYMLLRIFVPSVKLGGMLFALKAVLIAVSVFGFLLVQLAFIAALSGLDVSSKKSVVLTVLCAAVFAVFYFAPDKIGLEKSVFLQAVRDLVLILGCSFLGCLVSTMIKEPKMLLPIGIVAAMIDFWNVTLGPLGHTVATRPELAAKASVSLPTPVPGLPAITMGAGDIVFLALFFAVLFRFALNVKGTFWLGYGLLMVSILLVAFSSIALPALVPIGAAVLIMNYQYMKLTQDEMKSVALVLFILLCMLVAFTFVLTRAKNAATQEPSARNIIETGCLYG